MAFHLSVVFGFALSFVPLSLRDSPATISPSVRRPLLAEKRRSISPQKTQHACAASRRAKASAKAELIFENPCEARTQPIGKRAAAQFAVVGPEVLVSSFGQTLRRSVFRKTKTGKCQIELNSTLKNDLPKLPESCHEVASPCHSLPKAAKPCQKLPNLAKKLPRPAKPRPRRVPPRAFAFLLRLCV